MVNVRFDCLKCHRVLNGANAQLFDIASLSIMGRIKITGTVICRGCGIFIQRTFVVEEQNFGTVRNRIRTIFSVYKVKHPADVF